MAQLVQAHLSTLVSLLVAPKQCTVDEQHLKVMSLKKKKKKKKRLKTGPGRCISLPSLAEASSEVMTVQG